MTISEGCYVDGHWGQYGIARMVDLAAGFGYADKDIIELANAKLVIDPIVEFTVEDEEMLNDAADEVEDWLNDNVAEDGYMWGWYDGEFFYQKAGWFDV